MNSQCLILLVQTEWIHINQTDILCDYLSKVHQIFYYQAVLMELIIYVLVQIHGKSKKKKEHNKTLSVL